jgi:hypothetical protein
VTLAWSCIAVTVGGALASTRSPMVKNVAPLASVKVPVALLLGDEFPQPEVEPAKTSTSSDAPLPGVIAHKTS